MNNTDKPVIVVICGDPGGTSAVIPVIKKILSEKKVRIRAFAYREAGRIMEKNHVPFFPADEDMDLRQIRQSFEEARVSFLLTGTSYNQVDLEKKFIQVAKEMVVPSIAILDFWSNYSARFSDAEGVIRYIPDKIAIMDETVRSDMIQEGFNPESLVVTGQPAFDGLEAVISQFNCHKKTEILAHLGIHPGELVVSFFSQPLSKIYGSDKSNPRFLGFSESTVLQLLITSLKKISAEGKQEIYLIVRPHPREDSSNYKQFEYPGSKVLVPRMYDSREIALASDLVTGMNTELLVEACYMGCLVASLQPGLRFKDCLPTNKMGYSIPVYSEAQMDGTIRTALMDPDFRSDMTNKLDHFRPDGHATDKIVRLVYQMIGITTDIGDYHGKTGN